FQAEDGIRDRTVTGVQTCALPIWILEEDDHEMVLSGYYRDRGTKSGKPEWSELRVLSQEDSKQVASMYGDKLGQISLHAFVENRSEERRVGKECRTGCGGDG